MGPPSGFPEHSETRRKGGREAGGPGASWNDGDGPLTSASVVQCFRRAALQKGPPTLGVSSGISAGDLDSIPVGGGWASQVTRDPGWMILLLSTHTVLGEDVMNTTWLCG